MRLCHRLAMQRRLDRSLTVSPPFSSPAASSSSSASVVSAAALNVIARRAFTDSYNTKTSRSTRAGRENPHNNSGQGTAQLRNVTIPDAVHRDKNPANFKTTHQLYHRQLRSTIRRRNEAVMWYGSELRHPDHPKAKHLGGLSSDVKYRSAAKKFVLTGKKQMEELYRSHKILPSTMFMSSDKEPLRWVPYNSGYESQRQGDIVGQGQSGHTEVIPVASHTLDALHPGNDGYVGEYDMPPLPNPATFYTNSIAYKQIVVFDNVTNPGQLGNMIRTAVGFGYDLMVFINHCADVYDPAVVRAARLAHFTSSTKFLILSSEAGDDVYGMINHLVQRNKLSCVSFSPFEEQRPSVPAASSSSLSSTVTSGMMPSMCPPKPAMSMHQYLHHRFTAPDVACRDRHMIFIGPDYQGSMNRRLAATVRVPVQPLLLMATPPDANDETSYTQEHRHEALNVAPRPPTTAATAERLLIGWPEAGDVDHPTTGTPKAPPNVALNAARLLAKQLEPQPILAPQLSHREAFRPQDVLLLEEPTLEQNDAVLETSFASVLHAFRHGAQYDYLPTMSSAGGVSGETESSEVGAEYLFSPEPHEDGEDIVDSVRGAMEYKRQVRLRKYRDDDTTIYMKAQEERIRNMGLAELDAMSGSATKKRRDRFTDDGAEWVKTRNGLIAPPAADRMEFPNRDTIREVHEWRQTYQAPPDHRMRPSQ